MVREGGVGLPPDATFEDAIGQLVFLAKIDTGLAELDAGQGVPHDEVKRRLGIRWQSDIGLQPTARG